MHKRLGKHLFSYADALGNDIATYTKLFIAFSLLPYNLH